MLLKIQLPFSVQTIELQPSLKGNKVSILIGENGTRKSYLLRQVLEDGLASIAGELALGKNFFSHPPSKIIALSALPSDRFPSKNTYFDHLKKTKFDVAEYTYIGPRTARNIISRNQSARELIASVFLNLEALKKKGRFISEICEKVGVSTFVSFDLRVHSSVAESSDKEKIAVRLFDNIKKLSAQGTAKESFEEIFASLRKLEEYVHRQKLMNSPNVYPLAFKVWVDLERGQVDYDGVDPTVLEFGFRHDLLRASRITFEGGKSHEDLSTGQWASFSTLSAVALSVQNNSLILIDEPENGLHPLWQQEYVQNILSAIEHVKGCHVLIATHSPLILSSLPVDNSDCIVLGRSGGEVFADLKISPSGWDSNSLLEGAFSLKSPRGPELTDLVNSALKMISKGASKNKGELRNIAASLKMYRESLPETDMLKEIINSIIEISK